MPFCTGEKQKKWLLLAMSISLSMSFFEQSAVALTLPTLQSFFGISNTLAQWIINSYLLAIAIFIMLAGKLADLYSYRYVYLSGIATFGLASLLCSLSNEIHWLLAARFLQGIGSAIIMPASSLIIIESFAANERGKAMGTYVGSASLMFIVGPVVGGFFTQSISWRLIYAINIPLCLICFGLAYRFVRPKIQQVAILNKSIDWPGFALLSISLCSFIFYLMEGAILGWLSQLMILILITAIISLIFFIFIERYVKAPLIDVSLFKINSYMVAIFTLFCLQFALATTIFRALWLQQALGYSPALAGILLLPGTIPLVFMFPLAGKLADQYGAKRIEIIGMTLTLIGLLYLAIFMQKMNYLWLIPGFIIFATGIPLVTTPNALLALTCIDPKKRGTASGIYNIARQVGNSLALAMLGGIISTTENHWHPLTTEMMQKAFTHGLVIASYVVCAIFIMALWLMIHFNSKKETIFIP